MNLVNLTIRRANEGGVTASLCLESKKTKNKGQRHVMIKE